MTGGTLGALAVLLTGEHNGIVRGDDARRQVTAIVQPVLMRLMASGMTAEQAMAKMLAEHQ